MNILVIGGTGTLGRALISKYYAEGIHNIFCYSRDELKQQELKRYFPKVRCILGDIREKIDISIGKLDLIYHVAALKHIDVIENNVAQAVKTNIHGTFNVANFAIKHKVPRVAFASTDKACFPINVYGNTKAVAERYLQHLNESQNATQFRVFRWGNVLGSRGSVAQAFAKSLKTENKIYLTHPDMTRFWIKVDDAVRFMVNETEFPTKTGVLIPDIKASTVLNLAYAVAARLELSPNFLVEDIGMRPGEKIHEDIDGVLTSETADQYSHAELCALLEGAL